MTEKLIKYGAGGKPMVDEKQTLIEVSPEVPEVTPTKKKSRKKKLKKTSSSYDRRAVLEAMKGL